MRVFERDGFNAEKPAVHTRVRLAKAADVLRIRPQAIVLGTSRSHVGLRMAHPGWAAEPRYNLAFDGATTKEMYAYLRHAQTAGGLRQVVLGLDTWQLGAAPSSVRPDFVPELLLDGSAASTVRSMTERTRLLFSLDTLVQSWRTLRSQGAREQAWFAADGQRLGEVFFRRPGESFTEHGPGAYFAEIDRLEIAFKLPPEGPVRPRRAEEPTTGPSSFDYIGLIVAFCRAEGIDLRMFITPAHAHQLEISAAVGEWPRIEAGKHALVALVAADAAAHGAAPFPLWDFSGYSAVTTESVPPAGSRAEMRYYWDSSHFKEAVGDMVLDRVLGAPGAATAPEDFGRRLTAGTVDAVLAEIRAGAERYRRSHPGDVAEIAAMVATRGGAAASAPLHVAGTK